MGGICLVAVFWFGSVINEQPAAPRQPIEHVFDATGGARAPLAGSTSQVAAKSQGGLLSAFFDAPAKPRPVTLSDLQSRSTKETAGASIENQSTPFVEAESSRLPKGTNSAVTEVVSDFVTPPLPGLNNDSTFVAHKRIDQQRLDIVPDFSTLAQDFRREQASRFQPNVDTVKTSAVNARQQSMLPVPELDEFSRAPFEKTITTPKRDWNAVRRAVMSVEDKLKQFHNAHPEAEEFEPLKSASLQLERPMTVAATRTSGRFVPEPTVRFEKTRQQGNDARQLEQMEVSLAQYERQELERQEIQRQELLRRRPQSLAVNSSRNNSDASTARSIPPNELRSNDPYAQRIPSQQSRFEPAYRAQKQESFAQRQARWKMFDDRPRETKTASDRQNIADDRVARSRSSSKRDARPEQPRTIPETSRVRSLYEMPTDDEARRPQRFAAEQQAGSNRDDFVSSTQRRRNIPEKSLESDGGPEIIRYRDFKTYRTRGGDSLQTISESFFGTPEYYFDLYLANRNVLANPATVPVGVELKIPRMGQ
jgi:nucleoid-associated protein YgaU